MPDRYELRAARPQAALADTPFHRWNCQDGSAWTEFYRLDGAYLLRFPGLADFQIAAPRLDVSCHPEAGISEQTLEHLYLNVVAPLVLSKRGQLVFHASAVVIDQVAVAFVGESGRGKSTLAAAFALAGHPFLTDDGLVVVPEQQGFLALPSHPSLRLWSDSELALLPPDSARTPPVSYTSKARFLAGAALAFHAEPVRLGSVYFLGDRQKDVFQTTSVKASDALIEWVRHSFLLDIEEQPRVATHFDQVGALARCINHYRLDYPRSFDTLDLVVNAVIEQVRSAA